jgi:hypothetical protein
MATTTNFGWTTPDDSEAIKNGALATRTLGSAVDTSLVDLKGGTTGQLLAKNSATDMDFVWTTSTSGSMTLLSTTTLSGVGTTISEIPQGYKSLFISINNFYASAGAKMRIHTNGISGNAPGASIYAGMAGYETSIECPGFSGTTLESGSVFGVLINNYSTSIIKLFQNYGIVQRTFQESYGQFGGINTTSPITSIEVRTTGNTATISGTVYMYGIN